MRLIRILAAALLFAAGPLFAGESPESVAGATTVDVNQAKALFEAGALFVDPRRDSDWEAGRIPGAVHLELKSAFTEEALAAEAGKDEPVVFYCNGPKCARAAHASEKAVSWGYIKVNYFRDGFPAWQAAGNAVE
ncbi:rhodanese-like domain-containing protein [Endothiovibrio diazotrophicus]